MTAPEFSRRIDIRSITGQVLDLAADETERAALAQRFDLVGIARLEAQLQLSADGPVITASGTLMADIIQRCAVSGEDLPVAIAEPLALRFVPAGENAAETDEEIELEAQELDEIPYEGTGFDLGEALAQSLALAIDPYAVGPEAEAARKQHGLIAEGESGPLADALRGLTGR